MKTGAKSIIADSLHVSIRTLLNYDVDKGIFMDRDHFYFVGHSHPTADARVWSKHPNQRLAKEQGTNLWYATALDGSCDWQRVREVKKGNRR